MTLLLVCLHITKMNLKHTQFKQNKHQQIAVILIGVFIYMLFYFPTHYFMPDMTTYDNIQRSSMLILFSASMWYVFQKKQNSHLVDIFICFFSILASNAWLVGCYMSKLFDTPSFLIANAAFMFTCSILVKTKLLYSLISALVITVTTITLMLIKYDDMVRAFYVIAFIFIPIIVFALIFSW